MNKLKIRNLVFIDKKDTHFSFLCNPSTDFTHIENIHLLVDHA